MPCYRFLDFFILILKFLRGVKSFKALIAKIYLITNGFGGQQVLTFPNSNSKNINAGTTAGFAKRSAGSSSKL